jgi:hypothetical protein
LFCLLDYYALLFERLGFAYASRSSMNVNSLLIHHALTGRRGASP